MDREVSISTELAVGLVALAAFLGLLFYVVQIGRGIQADTAESLENMNNSISADYVQGLVNGEISNEMPAVTAYNILTRYYQILTESANGVNYSDDINFLYFPDTDSRVTNILTSGSDLANNLATLSGRVQLEIIPTGQGTYIVLIHPGNSLWSSGIVDTSCEHVGAYLQLLAKYDLTPSWTYYNAKTCGPNPL